MSKKISGPGGKIFSLVERLRVCTGERDMYPIVRDMLTDRSLGVGLTARHIVVDTNLVGQAAAPDLAIYSDVGGRVVRDQDHLYAIIEAKPRSMGVAKRERVLKDKESYIQAGTRWFFVVDQNGVARLDLDAESTDDARWHLTSWTDLCEIDSFRAMFGCVSISELRLEHQLAAFEAGTLRFAHRDVARFGRRAFIGTVRSVSQQLTGAVERVVENRLAPAACQARRLVQEMAKRWGAPQYDWADRRGHPIEFARMVQQGHGEDLTAEESREYAEQHAEFANQIAPHLVAHRIETEILPIYAAKRGTERVLFGATDKKSRQSIATFSYETASLIMSRMLMVRFSGRAV